MGWLSTLELYSYRQRVRNLDPETRAALTWTAAAFFVPPDTLMLAEFGGLRAAGTLTPFEAVCKVNRCDLPEGGDAQ